MLLYHKSWYRPESWNLPTGATEWLPPDTEWQIRVLSMPVHHPDNLSSQKSAHPHVFTLFNPSKTDVRPAYVPCIPASWTGNGSDWVHEKMFPFVCSKNSSAVTCILAMLGSSRSVKTCCQKLSRRSSWSFQVRQGAILLIAFQGTIHNLRKGFNPTQYLQPI
jgi:hypothetical protein